MPSALETLVKILKLEREQGYKNAAVIGGLGAYSEKWSQDAHAQARRPEHHALVDELTEILRGYEALPGRNERHAAIGQMIDRITGRLSAPPPRQEPEQGEPRASDEPGGLAAQSGPPPGEGDRQPARDAGPRGRVSGPGDGERGGQARSGGRDRGRQGPPPPPRGGGRGRLGPANGESAYDEAGGAYDFFGGPVRGGGPAVMDLPARLRLSRPPRKPRAQMEPDEAADLLRGLSNSVDKVKGIGPQKAEQLRELGIQTINDLLFYLPRRYDDYTMLLPIRRLQPDIMATVIGTVRQAEMRIGRGGRKDFFVVVDDGSASMSVTFFGRGQYLGKSIKPGMPIVLRGTTGMFQNRIQMTNPDWERVEPDNLQQARIVPVYPLTEGVAPRMLRDRIKDALDYWADRIPDYMPEAVLERGNLADLGWTLRQLHFPEGMDHLAHAKRRFIFDQLIMLQLAILAQRRAWQSVPSVPLPVSDEWLSEFQAAVFPYALTGAQTRALADIRADIAREVPMNRLLQGDVGSGKTAVAILALAMAFANGKQSAIMAPTSILAEQHYRTLRRLFDLTPGERKPVVALLTSALTTSERESVYRGIADGSIDMVVGTHAILQEGVEFRDLALAVIDEQHRFGVEQRGALRGKGTNPHLLVMTATPIPRTLALTLYADLDLSVMDELPPGRQPVRTRVLTPAQRERAYNFVSSQIEQGRQAFIVYPLVEASEKIEAESAVEAYHALQQVFREFRLGLLHGRMKPQEKDETMKAFAAGQYDILVTTSVAEVGVDIPNASIIMIEGANRFGLAQLHQFRGRVGRGEHASYCLLVADVAAGDGEERLKAMEATNDGFKLAEKDWELRGPGELVGTRQSGAGLVQLAADMTPDLVELAQREARTLYAEDPTLQLPEHRLLRERVVQLQDDRSDLS